jgi:hypothetical protein
VICLLLVLHRDATSQDVLTVKLAVAAASCGLFTAVWTQHRLCCCNTSQLPPVHHCMPYTTPWQSMCCCDRWPRPYSPHHSPVVHVLQPFIPAAVLRKLSAPALLSCFALLVLACRSSTSMMLVLVLVLLRCRAVLLPAVCRAANCEACCCYSCCCRCSEACPPPR